MVTGFLFDVLPGLLMRLAEYYQGSMLYRTAQRIWRWFRELLGRSFLYRLIYDRTSEVWERSGLYRAVDCWLDKLIGFVRRMLLRFTGGTMDFAVFRLWKKLRQRSPLFSLTGISGMAVLVIILIPGQYWYNAVGLVITLFLFAGLLLRAVITQRQQLLKRVGVPLFLFALATVYGVAVAEDYVEALRVFTFFLSGFLLEIVIACAVDSREKMKRLLGLVYTAVVISGMIAFVQRILGVETSSSLTDLANNAGMPGRVFSTFENPNNYAELLVLLIPVSAVFCTMVKGRNQKVLAWGGMIFPVGALLMTYSRSCWVSMALTVLVFVLLYRRELLPVLFVLAICMLPVLPDSVMNRILTIGSSSDSSNTYRLYIWDSALMMLHDYGLVGIGLGPGNFAAVYENYSHGIACLATHTHMVWLEIWLEMGILGIGAFLVFYLHTIGKGLRAMGQSTGSLRLITVASLSSLVGIAFAATAEYIFYYPRIILMFFLLVGILSAACNLAEQGGNL